MLRRCLLAALLAAPAAAHSSLLRPPCRNSIEHTLPQWQKNPFYSAPDGWGCDCKNGTSACNVGQACFWFSQGTTIGCEHATGAPSNPNTQSFCNSSMKATVNDPKLRTYNRAAAAGSAADIYKHNPWRAPGSAPVFHPCKYAAADLALAQPFAVARLPRARTQAYIRAFGCVCVCRWDGGWRPAPAGRRGRVHNHEDRQAGRSWLRPPLHSHRHRLESRLDRPDGPLDSRKVREQPPPHPPALLPFYLPASLSAARFNITAAN